MRCRPSVTSIATIALSFIAANVSIVWLRHSTFETNIARIKRGMSEMEVDSVLGPPTTSIDRTKYNFFLVVKNDDGTIQKIRHIADKTWVGWTSTLQLAIDGNGFVAFVSIRESETVTEKLSRWFDM